MAWNEYSLSKKKFAVDKDFHARNKQTTNNIIAQNQLLALWMVEEYYHYNYYTVL